ncbi:PAS domain S-box protein [Parendozoicomonas haliclonae]|uniref:histidine kinase n=1 Tax=Parendozoicomonas haliclonae TaxID=1960125 RepID=A0A1X7AH35_9GAMM|nr:PAS domain S-box protein [Parendozoicomonas haliclonae]SMA40572.1 Aerobic respiration control sensor protein ArcB [Parendozoicomonas haliclonae]
MTLSIRQKIVLFAVIPVTLIYNLIFITSLMRDIRNETRYLESHLMNTVSINAEQLGRLLSDNKRLARGVAFQLQVMSTLQQEHNLMTADVQSAFDNLSVGFGVAVRKPDAPLEVHFQDRIQEGWQQLTMSRQGALEAWLNQFMESGQESGWSHQITLYSSTIEYEQRTGYIYAVRYDLGKTDGAALAFIPLNDLARTWEAPSGIQPQLVLLNKENQPIFFTDSPYYSNEALYSDWMAQELKDAMAYMDMRDTSIVTAHVAGREKVLYRAKLGETGWTLVGNISKETVYNYVGQEILFEAVTLFITWVLIFIGAWFSGGRIVRPLRLLDRAMEKVAAGELNTRIDLRGNDEISHLADRFSDMTRRLKEREELEWKMRTASFEHIVQALSPDYFYFTHNADGIVTHASPSVQSCIGISVEDFCSHYTTYYTDSPDNIQAKRVTGDVLNGATSGVYEVELHDGNGRISYMEVVKVPIFDFEGRIIGAEGMGRNITRRVSDAARFRGLLESAPDAMVITDTSGCITMVNARAEMLVDNQRYALIGKPLAKLFPDTERKDFPFLHMNPDRRKGFHIRNGLELDVSRRDGSKVPVELTLSPIETPDGVLISIFMRDISDRRAAERALKNSEARFGRMIESLQQEYIFYTQSLDGDYVYVTDSVKRILGYSVKEFKRNSANYIHTEADRNMIRNVFFSVASGKIHPSYEVEVRRADGSICVLEVLESPAFDDQGRVTAIEGMLRDRTRERIAAVALAEARDEAEAANEAKTQFLSNMSHELRTPLNGVLGYAQLLLARRGLAPEQHSQLQGIQTCGQHLLTLINDILDLTKAESGNLELNNKPVNIPVLVDSVEQILYQRAEIRGLPMQLVIHPDVPVMVKGDETKLRQVLINLLGNAIKYTDEGWVRLEVSADKNWLCFDVTDTGMGIPQDQIEYIFAPFRQGDGGRREGGTGLGLAISQRIAAAMDGEISVTSQPGKGSHFQFCIPLDVIESSDDTGNLQRLTGTGCLEDGQDVRVVVVDDSETNRHILVQLLVGAGFKAISVDSGRKAVEICARERVDLVFMDLRMPDMSGFRATRMLKRHDDNKDVPVIAISAGVYPSLFDDMKRWGFADFIGKPFRSKELFKVIRRHLNLCWIEQNAVEPVLGSQPDVTVLSAKQATLLADRLTDVVDVGDISEISSIADELMNCSGVEEKASRHWADSIRECCDSLDFEGLEQLIEQLRVLAGSEECSEPAAEV